MKKKKEKTKDVAKQTTLSTNIVPSNGLPRDCGNCIWASVGCSLEEKT